MDYTVLTIEAERIALLEGENRGDIISLLSAPSIGTIQEDWDE